MAATLRNLTDAPVTVDGQTLSPASQPVGCTDPLPAPVVDSYLLVPACLASTAAVRTDVIWSASIPYCGHCAPVPSKRGWFAKLAHNKTTNPTLRVVEHYTLEGGWQGVGMEFFRRRYLQ
jgi:hypothetical protein